MRKAIGERRGGEKQAAGAVALLSVPRSAFRVSRSKGYSLVEMLAALAIFSIFLIVLVGLQREFTRYDGEVRLAMFAHPSPLSVLARLRRDVLDSNGYPKKEGSWIQSPDTLLLYTMSESDRTRIIVWDFHEAGIARRIELEGTERVAEWEARNVPDYRIGKWIAPDGRVGLVVTAQDGEENVVVDQIVMPRAH